MATCSLSFSGQGQTQENYLLPWYANASIVMGEQLLKNNSHPWHPGPTITTLPTQRFWVTNRLQRCRGSPSVSLHHQSTLLKPLRMALFCPDGSLQSTLGYNTSFTSSFSKMPGSFWSTSDVNYSNLNKLWSFPAQ